MITVLTREDLDLLAPRSGIAPLDLARLSGIALHHSGVKDSGSAARSPSQYMRQMQRYFLDTRGYSDIAYNFVINGSGQILEGRGLRYRSAANGSVESNGRFLAVMFPGDFRADARLSAEQISSFQVLRAFLRSVAPAAVEVLAHSSLRATACPGSNIAAELAQLAVDPPPPQDPPPRPVLQRGASGEWVECLQRMLNAWVSGVLDVDGVFSTQTDAVVRWFQGVHSIVIDGVVGPQTWAVLEQFSPCDGEV